ncbi:MAG: radical SAM protein [Sporomusaceae bacterium]|nr:radical SAM protein [Sporomusaceae bacterium]
MSKIDVLLVYPQLGSFDGLLRDIPLSLIYAAVDSVKCGFKVNILDLRLHPEDWEQQLDVHMQRGCKLVGLSVMTGNPITTSLRISEYVKTRFQAKVVWGGPHPTILPEQTLENPYIDFIIRDWGSTALMQLCQYLSGELQDIRIIKGLGHKENGRISLNEVQCAFEMPDYKDLPYHLVDIGSNNYNRLNNHEMIFPIFTSLGCPYNCTFCMSPAVYKKIKGKKWVCYSDEYVLSHIEYLDNKYDFQRLQVYDDDSFVDLERIRNLLTGYIQKGFHKKFRLDFRGARINELDRMDDQFLELMVEANVEYMAIGVESGSERSLKAMNKGITVEQIVRVNKKLARFPSLRPHYNFFCGIPGETMEDLIKTKELLETLLKDNPDCYLGVGADWKPIPGSVMTDEAVKKYNLTIPDRLSDWAAIDSFDAGKLYHPWYTKELDNMIKLLQIAGQLLDRKLADHRQSFGPLLGKVIGLLAWLYKPILRVRLRYNYTSFLFEDHIKRIVFRTLTRIMKKRSINT